MDSKKRVLSRCSLRQITLSVLFLIILISTANPFSFLFLFLRGLLLPFQPSDDRPYPHQAKLLSKEPFVDIDIQDFKVASFSPESNGGFIYYRNAPWRKNIGQWLSRCDSVTKHVHVSEVIYKGTCTDGCNSNGVCNQQLHKCRCTLGYAGEGCSNEMKLECNHAATREHPYGPFTLSMCPLQCDTRRAFCLCGEGTKYPNRPVVPECGFKKIDPSPSFDRRCIDPSSWTRKTTFDTIGGMNWTSADLDSILTTDETKPGWCNVDPEQAYSSEANFKSSCLGWCHNGFTGAFCEFPTFSTCLNQCSGHGYCDGGFCMCENGWYGVDCSIPSMEIAVQEWPKWLNPSINLEEKKPNESAQWITNTDANSIRVTVKKKRPLIYVYDLPSELDSQLIQGRVYDTSCVNREYDRNNRTKWTDLLYGSQWALYESILDGPHRTSNPEEADYFLVPLYDQCVASRADDAPYNSFMGAIGRTQQALLFYKKAYDHIVANYPYWNRSSGRDHIWVFAWDEGVCFAPKEIRNSIMLTHWGNTNSKHNYSTTSDPRDNWNLISDSLRGNYPCFDPDKDIVIPAWKKPEPVNIREARWRRPLSERKTLFYFRGNLGQDYIPGHCHVGYSIGIRQKVAKEFGSSLNRHGRLGRQHEKDVMVEHDRTPTYGEELSKSVFCGVFPGDGWSGRMEDSILHGCIPVIIQDGIQLPYENVLDYERFAVRIEEKDIPNMIKILRGINETKITSMMRNVQSIWSRFVYRDAIMLEADRQRRLFGDEKEWAIQYSKIVEDDVVSTIIQILHYKLYNDPWRVQYFRDNNRQFGLPEECKSNHKPRYM